MSKFTPGKWIYYPPTENDKREGLEDCKIFSVQGKIGKISTEEDARLIAAAPEMYQLLQALLEADNFVEIGGVCLDAKELLERIDGDSDVETKATED